MRRSDDASAPTTNHAVSTEAKRQQKRHRARSADASTDKLPQSSPHSLLLTRCKQLRNELSGTRMSNSVAPVATRTGDGTPTLLAGITFTQIKGETHVRQTTRSRARFPAPGTGTAAARPPDGALRALRPRHLRLPRGQSASRRQHGARERH